MADIPKLARVGDSIQCTVTHPFPQTITMKLETAAATAYANELLARGVWQLVEAAAPTLAGGRLEAVHPNHRADLAYILDTLCMVRPVLKNEPLRQQVEASVNGMRYIIQRTRDAARVVEETPEARRERLIANGYKTDSRCKWLAIGRCAECGREHDAGVAPSDDAQRLDWLQGFAAVSLEAWFTGDAIERRVTRHGHTIGSGRTLREAIDAARTACPRGPADFPGSAAPSGGGTDGR